MAIESKHPETLSLHGVGAPMRPMAPVAVPIYQTTSYQFHDTEHAANLFALKEMARFTRALAIRRTGVLESRLAALEAASRRWRSLGAGGSAFACKSRARRRQYRSRPIYMAALTICSPIL